MIHKIRTSRLSKIIASYLAIQLIITTVQPSNLFALTGGPSQPEFNSFTPIGTSDMVNLSSGDFNYNIPIMDVGGYPLNLSYDSGIGMDQEASWVGLGWNLNVGQINRQVRGLPDDFNGDEMRYENHLKDNITAGANIAIHPAVSGGDIPINISTGLGVNYNNYVGWFYTASSGVSFEMSDNIALGMSTTNSSQSGVTIQPSLNYRSNSFIQGATLGAAINSREGLMGLNVSAAMRASFYNNNNSLNTTTIGLNAGFGKSFSNTTYTPNMRTSSLNTNISGNVALGTEFFGFEGQLELYAYGTVQSTPSDEKDKLERAYGYNYTENATTNDVLDFNRENDRTITKNVNVLPVTNYTYDLYSIKGQGVSGMFQPYRSQVGYVYDRYVKDKTKDVALGGEIGVGNLLHFGVEVRYSPSKSSTGLWDDASNEARGNFTPLSTTDKAYEKVYYKTIGELNVDNDYNLLADQLGGEAPVKVKLWGSNLNKKTAANGYIKGTDELLSEAEQFGSSSTALENKVSRSQRQLRNQSIQTLTKKEATSIFGSYAPENKPSINPQSKSHHSFQTRILQPDGSTYVYGQPAYNTKKIEASFNVHGNSSPNGIAEDNELIAYSTGNDNSANNSRGSNHYFNRVTTPAYAHSFLLTEVLSSDYEDLSGDGPTDDDLGAYTKIHYQVKSPNYRWRVPFEHASSNRGLNSLQRDDVGNYIYGEKELFYVDKIETKTHVAVFDLNQRNDGYGVAGENGGLSTNSEMFQINTISLYSKPEYQKLLDGDTTVKPIKVAHFEYDYSLCKGVPNNQSGYDPNEDDANEMSDTGGKLTLRKVYFTYRGSNMGRYTPYLFHYEKDFNGDGIIDNNPDYHIKGYDVWGNYKKPDNSNMGLEPFDEPSTSEYPYVEQNKQQQDYSAAAWTLTAIELPSGGKIEMDFESDDYAYVQNKKALQMFKVRGAGTDAAGAGFVNSNGLDETLLYEGTTEKRYLYIELPDEDSSLSVSDFQDKYMSEIMNDPIYFNFMLNMDKNKSYAYDYVSGYLKIDTENIGSRPFGVFTNGGVTYGAIPIALVDKNDSGYNNNGVHPISKAGWYFGRQYLNRLVYGQDEFENLDILDVAATIGNQIGNIYAIFQGPHNQLRQKKCAQRFSTTKSYLRLQNPNNAKLGGGLRVKKIVMYDHWDKMTGNENSANQDRYAMTYGQEYDYSLNSYDPNLNNRISSGVATFEPMNCKENPWVQPFYDDPNNDRILAPKDQNYTEKPFGISFFPFSKVTYSKVTVKNLDRGTYNNGAIVMEVGMNGTGKVVNEFYTSKDFPTIAKHTPLGDPNEVNLPGEGISLVTSLFGLNFVTEERLSMSQGFTVITNDMDGKMKSQQVYSESGLDNGAPISKVEYHYNINDDGELYNTVPVIDKTGTVEEKTIGVDYNVVNDFRSAKTKMETYGADVNVAVVVYPIPVPPYLLFITNVTPIPQLAFHNTELRTAVTTKVIHKSGFLVEKKAFDLGAEVTTKNIAWDADTGQVLLTQTENEYKDKYYNFSYPAYWAYEGMSSASINQGIALDIEASVDNQYTLTNVGQLLINGDEVAFPDGTKGWVTEVITNGFKIIGRNGLYINTDAPSRIKIIRSGHRNLQSANMASITLMKNPIDLNNDGNYNNIDANTFDATSASDKLIVNASAVKYKDQWPLPCECDLPEIDYTPDGNIIFEHEGSNSFNPYLYNILGDWRAEESYAYLTGRSQNSTGYLNRNSGYFNQYDAFYKPDGNGNWLVNTNVDNGSTPWTSASSVTRYSPYGPELENKDALGRYSSAQYGYGYKFPVAVASNSSYREIGFDGFEEDRPENCDSGHFYFTEASSISELNDQNSHSGNQSLNVKPGQSVVMQKTLVSNCLDDNDVDIGILLKDLINAVADLIESSSPIIDDYDNPCFTIPEFEAIKPYIDLGSGIEPQLCDVIKIHYPNNPNTFSFSFEHHSNWETVTPINCTNLCDNSQVKVVYDNASDLHSNIDIVEYDGSIYEENNNSYPLFSGANGVSGIVDFEKVSIDGQINGFCPECTSFAPLLGKSYVFSSWVKVDVPQTGTTPQNLLDAQPTSYQDITAKITYEALDGAQIATEIVLTPSGDIIEGWQQVVGEFIIPQNSAIAFMKVELANDSAYESYFDDVRIHPYNGSMKSFVYDNETYRLMAELDENNFATFYEYDNEGGLVRVKKETEEGIMTIQETRSGTSNITITNQE